MTHENQKLRFRPLATTIARCQAAMRLGLRAVSLWIALGATVLTTTAIAQPSAMIRLLQSGKLPEERQIAIVELIGNRGTVEDFSYLFQEACDSSRFSAAVRTKILDVIANASQSRNIAPKVDPQKMESLLASPDASIRLTGLRLIGIWKLKELQPRLEELLFDRRSTAITQREILRSLVRIAEPKSAAFEQTIVRFVAQCKDSAQRSWGVAALARISSKRAALMAAPMLAQPGAAELPIVLDAFLSVSGGTDELAAAFGSNPPTADAAKLVLRHMYSVGRADAALSAVLSKAAGFDQSDKLVTEAEINAVVSAVLSRGNAERGETVFRRADLSCLKCHSINGAGGTVGPDLRAIGSSSPIDYIVKSILTPELAVKEEFVTTTVLTAGGEIATGIVVDENADRLILKDASGKRLAIPISDVETRKKGGSLMPKGLVRFLTQDELIDLARFLSELGKDGPYAIPTKAQIRNWQVLRLPSEELELKAVDDRKYEVLVSQSTPENWAPAYALASGALPLAEMPPGEIVILRGFVKVTVAGNVAFRTTPMQGIRVWIEHRPITSPDRGVELSTGRHVITAAVRRSENSTLVLELYRPESSSAQFVVETNADAQP